MATALVIGGGGQIGRAAIPALLSDGWDVRVLARHAPGVEGVEPVLGDRADDEALDRALGSGVDVVVDVVAYDDRQAAPLLARRDRIGSAIVVSSAAVYVDAQGSGFESDVFGTFPVPVTEAQRTVGARPRLVRDRQGRARGRLARFAGPDDRPAPGSDPRTLVPAAA